MMLRCLLLASVAMALSAGAPSALAEDAHGALRPELFLSSDADGSETHKLGLGWDWHREDREHWFGAKVEYARFAGKGWSHEEQRIYARAAGHFGERAVDDDTWRWRVDAGTNGDTLLGSAALHTEGPNRREIFIEREVVETRQGMLDGQMYTFLGAVIDRPFSERASGNVLVGLQEYGDGNLRSHLRGRLVYVVVPEQGLSLQLRARSYRNSDPFAGDYFSPDWYGEVLGVIALRRVVGGHAWRAAAGAGRQKSAQEDARRARSLEFSYESPRWRRSWLRLNAGYTDTPVATSTGSSSYSYSYRYLMLETVIAL